MLDLNYLCKMSYENAKKRAVNEDKIKLPTFDTLKYCAGEIVEATDAYIYYNGNRNGTTKAVFADELADIICCVLTICGQENIDIELALTKCMERNFRRGHKNEAY